MAEMRKGFTEKCLFAGFQAWICSWEYGAIFSFH